MKIQDLLIEYNNLTTKAETILNKINELNRLQMEKEAELIWELSVKPYFPFYDCGELFHLSLLDFANLDIKNPECLLTFRWREWDKEIYKIELPLKYFNEKYDYELDLQSILDKKLEERLQDKFYESNPTICPHCSAGE